MHKLVATIAVLFLLLGACLLPLSSTAISPSDGPAQAGKKVIILGASGSLAKYVIDILAKDKNVDLTFFLRDKSRLRNHNVVSARIVEGDVFDYDGLRNAIRGQDVVYANLSGDLGRMAKNIVKAMNEAGVKQLIFICSIGIYNEPVKPVLVPYRQAADVIEASNLDSLISRSLGEHAYLSIISRYQIS